MIIILMTLCPPWLQTVTSENIHAEFPAGYHCRFLPPQPAQDGLAYGVRVDYSRWSVELVVAAFLIRALVGLFRDPAPRKLGSTPSDAKASDSQETL